MTEPKLCPKCGSEMHDTLEEVTVECEELWWEQEVWICPDCGHEEKVGGEKR